MVSDRQVNSLSQMSWEKLIKASDQTSGRDTNLVLLTVLLNSRHHNLLPIAWRCPNWTNDWYIYRSRSLSIMPWILIIYCFRHLWFYIVSNIEATNYNDCKIKQLLIECNNDCQIKQLLIECNHAGMILNNSVCSTVLGMFLSDFMHWIEYKSYQLQQLRN